MLRTFAMLAAVALVCLPLGGVLQIPAHAVQVGPLPALQADAEIMWFGPQELGILAGCVMVLALTATLVRAEIRRPRG